jgi:hypothetical protein
MAYDTLLDYLKGTLRYWEAPSTIYVATLHGYPDFLKIGFCQLGYRNLRRADGMIQAIVYETCNDKKFLSRHGDLERADAFLFEQYIHHVLTARREVIPELEEKRWNGRYETYRVPLDEQPAFLEKFRGAVDAAVGGGWASRAQVIGMLITTAEELRLFEKLDAEIKELQARNRQQRKAAA